MKFDMQAASVESTNRLLLEMPIGLDKPVMCFLTGSSGCGKTYLAEALAHRLPTSRTVIAHFDSVGVPTEKEMVTGWGSGRKWQEAMTHEWTARLITMRDKALAVLEGQYDPQFALDACKEMKITDFLLCVVSCEQRVWEDRLRGPRSQAYLITDDMRNWANVLREETVARGGAVIDTTESNLKANLLDFASLINPLLRRRIEG